MCCERLSWAVGCLWFALSDHTDSAVLYVLCSSFMYTYLCTNSLLSTTWASICQRLSRHHCFANTYMRVTKFTA